MMISKRRQKVLVLLGQSAYNVLRQAAVEIARGFQNKGYTVDVIDLNGNYSEYDEINAEYDFMFSCSAMLFEKDSVMNAIHIPYYGWIFDDPIYHYDRVMNLRRRNAILLLADQEWEKVARRMNPKLRSSYFLPCGGFPPKKKESKEIDILFPAVYKIEELSLEEKIKELMPVEKAIIEEAIPVLNANQMLTIREAIEVVFEEWGEKLTDDILKELDRVVLCIDKYYRHKLRRDILLAMLNAGLEVHIVGELNDELIPYKEQIVLYPPQDISDLVELIGKSKIVISPQLVAREGISERISTALLGKAACFSPVTNYLQNEYPGVVEPIYLNNLQQMVERIQWILENFDVYYSEIIEKNYEWAIEHDTWEKRGERIVELYEDRFLK